MAYSMEPSPWGEGWVRENNACSNAPLENVRLSDRCTVVGLQEIEIAAFRGLLDMLAKNVAVTALEARR